MNLNITTLEAIKELVETKLNNCKTKGCCFTDEERVLIDGKELAFEDIIDELNSLIKTNQLLEIGQKVKWTMGNVESIGVVLEEKGEFTTVITHYIGGKRSNIQIDVVTELLIKI